MRTKVAKNSSGGRGRTPPIPTCRPRLRIIGNRPICTTRTANLNWVKFSPVGGRPCGPSRMWAQRPLAPRRNRLLHLHLTISTDQAFWRAHVKPRPVVKGLLRSKVLQAIYIPIYRSKAQSLPSSQEMAASRNATNPPSRVEMVAPSVADCSGLCRHGGIGSKPTYGSPRCASGFTAKALRRRKVRQPDRLDLRHLSREALLRVQPAHWRGRRLRTNCPSFQINSSCK